MAFMVPQYVYGEFSLAEYGHENGWLPSEDVPRSHTVSERAVGWYYRLSANRYLDATDWTGPFKSEHEAKLALQANENVCIGCGDSLPDDDSTECVACETEIL